MPVLPEHSSRIAQSALEGLAGYFAGRPTRQGVLARAALGREQADDAQLQKSLLTRWERDIRPDGSVGGAVLPTVWRLHELADLHARHHPTFPGLIRWVQSLQDRPGAYQEGCTPVRHRHRACEHYLAGFFAPAPPTITVAPLTVPTGKTFRADPAARFAVSCLALHGLLRAGVTSPALDRHLAGLASLAEAWNEWDDLLSPDLIPSALAPLGASPAHRPAAEQLLQLMARNQEGDGGFRSADLFHLLDPLTRLDHPAAREILGRSVPVLVGRQRADGGFGGTGAEERSLIGFRALLATVCD